MNSSYFNVSFDNLQKDTTVQNDDSVFTGVTIDLTESCSFSHDMHMTWRWWTRVQTFGWFSDAVPSTYSLFPQLKKMGIFLVLGVGIKESNALFFKAQPGTSYTKNTQLHHLLFSFEVYMRKRE